MTAKHPSRHSSAVVTGAGSGIGRAFALELAARGGRVICSDINLKTAQETVQLIQGKGGKALAVKTDVAQVAEVESLAAEAEAWLDGPVTLVVNNAGVGVGGKPVGGIPLADWQWALGINLWGVVHGCHVFAPKLRALRQGGHRVLEVRKPVQDSFNAGIEARLAKMPIRADVCQTYYLDRSGRNQFVWPEYGVNIKKRLTQFERGDYAWQ